MSIKERFREEIKLKAQFYVEYAKIRDEVSFMSYYLKLQTLISLYQDIYTDDWGKRLFTEQEKELVSDFYYEILRRMYL